MCEVASVTISNLYLPDQKFKSNERNGDARSRPLFVGRKLHKTANLFIFQDDHQREGQVIKWFFGPCHLFILLADDTGHFSIFRCIRLLAKNYYVAFSPTTITRCLGRY